MADILNNIFANEKHIFYIIRIVHDSGRLLGSSIFAETTHKLHSYMTGYACVHAVFANLFQDV